MAVGKRLRFEVFKRDAFACSYCGRTPPEVILEVDHIHPKSDGGSDEMDNLQTSCFDCNRGKSSVSLKQVAPGWDSKAKLIEEREEQLAQYNALREKQRLRIEGDVDAVEDVFSEEFEGYVFRNSFRSQVRMFLARIPVIDVIDAMEIACGRGLDKDRTLKYFCGVVWRKIKNA